MLGSASLQEKEVPASDLHDFSPVDVGYHLTTVRGRSANLGLGISVLPDLPKESCDAAHGAKVAHVGKLSHAVVEERPESATGKADRAADEVDPDEASIET